VDKQNDKFRSPHAKRKAEDGGGWREKDEDNSPCPGEMFRDGVRVGFGWTVRGGRELVVALWHLYSGEQNLGPFQS